MKNDMKFVFLRNNILLITLFTLLFPVVMCAQSEFTQSILGIPNTPTDPGEFFNPTSLPVSKPTDSVVLPTPLTQTPTVDLSGLKSSEVSPNFSKEKLSGLIRCDGSKNNPCNFTAFVDTLNRMIEWIIGLAGVIFTMSLIYGGFLYVTSGDKPGNREAANKLLWNTLKGFVIILISWLIIYTILKVLVPSGSSVFKFIKS